CARELDLKSRSRAALDSFCFRRTWMTPGKTIVISTATLLGIALLQVDAVGQQERLSEQLLGTWTLVSHEAVSRDGSKSFPYGANPQGVAIFDAGGHFIITVMRSNRAKYAVAFPSQGITEENKATAEGTMTYFGTYSINETDRIMAIHIEASSF